MVTITAIIRVRQGAEAAMRQALLEVAAHVEAHEPRTVSFFVSQDSGDSTLFTTYERFVDRAAMDTHNGSAIVARFFAIANPLLEGKVMLVTADEISAKADGGASSVNGGRGLL
jgi:quinol monooxygenase YgiN